MIQANILEIFQSIQGEGKYVGVKQVFVRFFECNMHCSWCDTPASIGDKQRNFKKLTLDEVFNQIKQYGSPCHSVSLTGGEPLMQSDFIKALLPRLKEHAMPVHLETNGTLPDALETIIDDIDVIAMDLKLPSSTNCKPYWDDHLQFLSIAKHKDTFIKVVISNTTSQEDVEQAVALVSQVDPQMLFILQPNTYDLKQGVLSKCLEYHAYCQSLLPNTRLLPQMHKFLKIP